MSIIKQQSLEMREADITNGCPHVARIRDIVEEFRLKHGTPPSLLLVSCDLYEQYCDELDLNEKDFVLATIAGVALAILPRGDTHVAAITNDRLEVYNGFAGDPTKGN